MYWCFAALERPRHQRHGASFSSLLSVSVSTSTDCTTQARCLRGDQCKKERVCSHHEIKAYVAAASRDHSKNYRVNQKKKACCCKSKARDGPGLLISQNGFVSKREGDAPVFETLQLDGQPVHRNNGTPRERLFFSTKQEECDLDRRTYGLGENGLDDAFCPRFFGIGNWNARQSPITEIHSRLPAKQSWL